MTEILTIFIFLLICGAVGFCLTNLQINSLNKVIGYLTLVIVAYLFATLLNLDFLLSFILVSSVSLFLSIKKLKDLNLRFFLKQETYFLFWLFALLGYKAFSPEIFFGEKFMDIAFLSYFSNYTKIPPDDPWAVGLQPSYYYLHYLSWGSLAKLFNLNTGVLFNVLIALSLALAISLLADCISIFSKKSYIISPFFLLASNVVATQIFIFSNKELNFWSFWETTRIFPFPYFTEYPIWSFIFADLHPHYLNLPFFAGIVGSTIIATKLASPRLLSASILATASLVGFNAWDIVLASLLIGLSLVLSWKYYSEFCKLGIFVAALAAFFLFLFLQQSFGAKTSIYPNEPSPVVSAVIFVKHFGYLLIPQLFFVFTLGVIQIIGSLFLTLMVVLALSFFKLALAKDFFMLVSFFLLTNGLILLKTKYKEGLIVAGLNIIFFLVSLGVEVISIADRINTIFKLYFGLWVVLAFSSSLIVSKFLGKTFLFTGAIRQALQVFCLVVFSVVLVTNVKLLVLYPSFTFKKGPRPTIDGSIFLREENDLGRAALWLRAQIKKGLLPKGAVLEANAPSFSSTNFVSSFVGLPSVLGWEAHAELRTKKPHELSVRKTKIFNFYRRCSPRSVKYFSTRFRVKYVVSSSVEFQKFKAFSLRCKEGLKLIFDLPKAKIYFIR